MAIKKIIVNTYIYLILFILYLPIFLLIFYSFTDTTNIGIWNGFSSNLYIDLFSNKKIFIALSNTFIIAIISSLLSVILGTLGAIGTFYLHEKMQKIIETITQIPIVNAEIVIALSLMILFIIFNNIFNVSIFSFFTILIGHVCLSLPFVYFVISPKLHQMNPNLCEAAMDLGCTSQKTIFKIIIPQILPNIFSSFLLAFSLSLDDFIITTFLRGPGLFSGINDIETLTTFVQAKIKKGPIPSEMRALTTIFFLLIFIIGLLIYNYKKYKKNNNF